MSSETWRALGAPYYDIEEPRQDAAGRWRRTFKYPTPVPRSEALVTLEEYSAQQQDTDKLLTGCLLGDAGVRMVSSICFTRDPHPDASYRTLSSQEYDQVAGDFACFGGLNPGSVAYNAPFYALVGRVAGYGTTSPLSMDYVRDALPSDCSLKVREAYFFGFRPKHEPWHELAIHCEGPVHEVPVAASLAHQMRQARFVGEFRDWTIVYNSLVFLQYLN